MLQNMAWNYVFKKLTGGRFTCECDICGTPWPCLKAAGISLEPFKWTCSPACFDVYIDRLIGRASPAANSPGGAVWGPGDVGASLGNAGAIGGPSVRAQVERAINEFTLE